MTPPPSGSRPRANGLLRLFFLANYAVALANCASFVTSRAPHAALPSLWLGAVWLTYAFFFCLPPLAMTWLAQRALARPLRRVDPRLAAAVRWAPAVLGFAAVQLAIYADHRIRDLYGFHVDGFVWNIVATRGGIESLGASRTVLGEAAGLAAGVVAAEAALLALLARVARSPARLSVLRARRFAAGLVAAVAFLSCGERLGYAVALARDDESVLEWSDALPFYAPLDLDGVAKRVLGLHVARAAPPPAVIDGSQLAYPARPVAFRADAPRWNVVVLCSESLRADALDPEIMPATWRFAAGAARFTQHVSSGNGTRMGVFGLFYGLPGPYWFPLLAENRGPAMIRALLDRGYEVRGWTSTKFSYPEFDRTVFADVDRSRLSEGGDGDAWQRDRQQVGALLGFLAHRDRSRPFFAYEFFESPHAPYWFPPESVIRTPYARDLDYLTMHLDRDLGAIRNRYWNAVHHLDSQLARVFDALREDGLLDSTIVIVTGDHGEEFLEHGRWGHNSEFHEEQIRVPMVLWAPGVAPAVVDRLTSHLDVPATILSLLGATNPPADYGLGRSLLDPSPHPYVLVSDWSRVAYVDTAGKATFPMRPLAWFHQDVSDRRDAPLPDPGAFLEPRTANLSRVLSDLARFTRRAAPKPSTAPPS